jgi:hypothetical protein
LNWFILPVPDQGPKCAKSIQIHPHLPKLMIMCSNLQARQCCQPSLKTHNARVVSILSMNTNPHRSPMIPTVPLRPGLVNHNVSSSPPRLVTTHSGLFDQAWGTSIDVEVAFIHLLFQLIIVSLLFSSSIPSPGNIATKPHRPLLLLFPPIYYFLYRL